METKPRTLEFWQIVAIVKAYRNKIEEIDEQATERWGKDFFDVYEFRMSRISEEREICAMMVDYYSEQINETICLN
jgi:hypothetical protein